MILKDVSGKRYLLTDETLIEEYRGYRYGVFLRDLKPRGRFVRSLKAFFAAFGHTRGFCCYTGGGIEPITWYNWGSNYIGCKQFSRTNYEIIMAAAKVARKRDKR